MAIFHPSVTIRKKIGRLSISRRETSSTFYLVRVVQERPLYLSEHDRRDGATNFLMTFQYQVIPKRHLPLLAA